MSVQTESFSSFTEKAHVINISFDEKLQNKAALFLAVHLDLFCSHSLLSV